MDIVWKNWRRYIFFSNATHPKPQADFHGGFLKTFNGEGGGGEQSAYSNPESETMFSKPNLQKLYYFEYGAALVKLFNTFMIGIQGTFTASHLQLLAPIHF